MTRSHLVFELGGIPERDKKKLKEEAERILGTPHLCFQYYADKLVAERDRGITISINNFEFWTTTKHYSVIDRLDQKEFIQHIITGVTRADVALLLVAADQTFCQDVPHGKARECSLLLRLLGFKQLMIGVNKIDCEFANFQESKFDEFKSAIESMLLQTGWDKKFIKSIPILPISARQGDNIVKKSEKMEWWKGVDILKEEDKIVHIDNLADALEAVSTFRPSEFAPLRIPIDGVYKIKGIGDILTGRVEQGVLRPHDQVVFLPRHTTEKPCQGTIFSIEEFHHIMESAGPRDSCGFHVKGLQRDSLPKTGDVLVLKQDTTIRGCVSFVAQVHIIGSDEVKIGDCHMLLSGSGRVEVKVRKILWKGKEFGGEKEESPECLKSDEFGEVVFEPLQPLVVETSENCERLGRVSIFHQRNNNPLLLGTVVAVEFVQ